ncbi:MAG TPA: tail fiber domain-containing protein, partial [Chitinophagales bacterium]|nr:tail fiber domain-containing protein [Chitinophagales bacterium]
NVALGFTALQSDTDGVANVAIGSRAGRYLVTGNSNVAIGAYALQTSTGVSNIIAIGDSALYSSTTGTLNTAVGSKVLFTNLTGSSNTALGNNALYLNTSGSNNVAIGVTALHANVSQSYNVAVGDYTGNLLSSTSGTLIGWNADVSSSGYSNVTALGYSALTTASNQVRIGNSSVTSIGGYVGWSNISDGRFKKNVQSNVPGLEFITKLQPVTYNLDITGINAKIGIGSDKDAETAKTSGSRMLDEQAVAAKQSITYTGFIAQQVELAAKQCGFNFSGVDAPKNENDLYGLRYAEFVVPLVKAVQEQQEMIEELKKEIEALKNK